MSVSVHTDTNADKTHSDGYSIRVADSHLFVETREKFPVAVYAPGRWTSATASAPTEGPGSSAK